MSEQLILQLETQVDVFLAKWTESMDRAGYLPSTTAKREDCILSFLWFMQPLWENIRAGEPVADFYDLIQNAGDKPDLILGAARRHRFRGITAEMFIGCFKTMVKSIEDMALEMDGTAADKLGAVLMIRNWADVLETRIIGDWSAMSQQEADERLDASNRSLTLEKNKYENILSVISDLVLVVDDRGAVLEINRAVSERLQGKDIIGAPVWRVLGLEVSSMDEMILAFSAEYSHEIETVFAPHYYELHLEPLNRVSLASSDYLLVLRDISTHVHHREILESTVAERTKALEKEKAQLEEVNITMRTVLKTIDTELQEHKRSIAGTVEKEILPALKRARGVQSAEAQAAYLDLLEDQLLALCSDGGGGRNPLLLKLSPTELKICEFIQAGSSSKAIADAMNLSEGTVQTHRKNIRKKLNIQNKTVNLYSFLQHGA